MTSTPTNTNRPGPVFANGQNVLSTPTPHNSSTTYRLGERNSSIKLMRIAREHLKTQKLMLLQENSKQTVASVTTNKEKASVMVVKIRVTVLARNFVLLLPANKNHLNRNLTAGVAKITPLPLPITIIIIIPNLSLSSSPLILMQLI